MARKSGTDLATAEGNSEDEASSVGSYESQSRSGSGSYDDEDSYESEPRAVVDKNARSRPPPKKVADEASEGSYDDDDDDDGSYSDDDEEGVEESHRGSRSTEHSRTQSRNGKSSSGGSGSRTEYSDEGSYSQDGSGRYESRHSRDDDEDSQSDEDSPEGSSRYDSGHSRDITEGSYSQDQSRSTSKTGSAVRQDSQHSSRYDSRHSKNSRQTTTTTTSGEEEEGSNSRSGRRPKSSSGEDPRQKGPPAVNGFNKKVENKKIEAKGSLEDDESDDDEDEGVQRYSGNDKRVANVEKSKPPDHAFDNSVNTDYGSSFGFDDITFGGVGPGESNALGDFSSVAPSVTSSSFPATFEDNDEESASFFTRGTAAFMQTGKDFLSRVKDSNSDKHDKKLPFEDGKSDSKRSSTSREDDDLGFPEVKFGLNAAASKDSGSALTENSKSKRSQSTSDHRAGSDRSNSRSGRSGSNAGSGSVDVGVAVEAGRTEAPIANGSPPLKSQHSSRKLPQNSSHKGSGAIDQDGNFEISEGEQSTVDFGMDSLLSPTPNLPKPSANLQQLTNQNLTRLDDKDEGTPDLNSMLERTALNEQQGGLGERSVTSRRSHQSSSSRRSSIRELLDLKAETPTRSFTGYTRVQMRKLSQVPRSSLLAEDDETGSIPGQGDPKSKKKRRGRVKAKTEALLDLAAKVSAAMVELEEKEAKKEIPATPEPTEGNANVEANMAIRVLHKFEELTGVLLQLSDELELLLTFEKNADTVAIGALKTLIRNSKALDDIFGQLEPILIHYVTAEMNEEMEDFLYGMNLIAEQLTEICYRVGEKRQWNARANTSYLTLLELLARDTLEVTCIYDDVDTPGYTITKDIQKAWEMTGHEEEIKTLLVTPDLSMFRQICYEVMLSCDQWCPDTDALMDICAIEDVDEEEPPKPDNSMVPTPEAALQVLEKINGEYLPRISMVASVLRRILPTEAVNDPRMKDSFAKIRSAGGNPMGLSPSTLVSISSIPEDADNEEALGVAGVGKTTLAAIVANHSDVRRFFGDGIAWVYIGPMELNYTRYVQCLQDLIRQLEVEEDEEPLFPELLHTPGESKAKRRRREEGFMIFVRETMVEFLEKKNVLIVLDDVCFDPDLDWFDFTPPVEPEEEEGSCVVLATSRRRNLLPAADTVEVDMLDIHEGVKLLIKESGALSKVLLPESAEVKSVVVECAGHALAIKSMGRWLNLKHSSNGVASSTVEEIHRDIVLSMDKILKHGSQDEADMMYGILNMSLSPAINGQPTTIIKFCFAAFVKVFCEKKYISDFALADSTPIVPLTVTEQLFEALLNLEEETLMKEGSLYYAKKSEAASLIPEALSALGVFKVIITFVEDKDEGGGGGEKTEQEEEKYYQIMHKIQQEYGEYLYEEDGGMAELVKDGERRWNKAFAQAYLAKCVLWDTESPDAGLDYALETMPSHLYRGGMLTEAANLLSNKSFVRGRLFALGRENGTRRQIKDGETLFDLMMEQRVAGKKKYDAKGVLKQAYQALGDLLYMDEDELIAEEGSPEAVEVGRSHFDIGLSLAEKRCWDAAIVHWEKSQELLVSALGMVELVAAVLFNVGVVYAELHEYEQALSSLKQCLKIRGAIHGEEHILYAQTIQKIGDIFLGMSDYHEAMESYNWALDVMHIEPSHHRIDIGDILENMGNIHYSKGETGLALQCFQDALRSKQVDLGEDHPELATTFQNIGNCLSDQGKTEEAIAHFEEAIRLKNLDPEGGAERDADVLTIEGILHNLHGKQHEGLECYEKALQCLVTKAPHRKEKVASLLHLIGCVYLMSGEHKKAMKLFEESLQARRKVLGFVHLDVASTLFNMAFLHQCRNRLDKALKCLEEALKIRQLRLPDSEKVAVTHEKIGNLARSLGKTKKAEIAFNEALRIRKLVHGENHEAVATVLQELGDLMEGLGDYDAAMKSYVQALEIRESRLGPDDLAVAETYYSMGFTLQNNLALDRALQCFEESLSIRKFQLGDDAKEVGDTLNMMGFLQAQRGELDDAIKLLWEALRIRKLHEDAVKVSETLKNIGNVHREKKEFEDAVECYEECLRIRRAELGDFHEKLADALIAMGNVQSDMNATADAMESYKEALSIRIRLFGEQDESVASVLQYMGTLEFRCAELSRAYQLLDEFVRIRQENGTEPDGDYVNVLFMIGNIHKMQGEEEEAQKKWTEAYDVFQDLGLAETNPQIAEVMSTLVKEALKKDKKKGVKGKVRANTAQTHHIGELEKGSKGSKGSKGVFGRIAGKMKNNSKGNKL